MKRKIATILIAFCFSCSLIACNSDNGSQDQSADETDTIEESQEPTNLTGVWTSEENNGSYQEAIISENTIEINWVSDGGITKSIYWIGTYTAPNEAVDEYSWVSERDKEKTDSALLASTDDTKDFTYANGKISYEVSALGTTTTVELTQTSKEVPDGSIGKETTETPDNQNQQSDVSYEITNQKILFHQDSIGTIWSQAIVEVENTGNVDLYLDYGSYELVSQDSTIIHTTNNMFIPYPQIISPGEKGYYYEETTMDAGTPTEGITITPHIDVTISKNENIQLEVSDTEIYDKEMGSIDLHGKVKNTTDITQDCINVVAILFDQNNEPIGQLYTILMNSLQPGEEMGFELEAFGLPDTITKSSIADYKVFAYPDQFQF